jgi:cytochrome c peroxidase
MQEQMRVIAGFAIVVSLLAMFPMPRVEWPKKFYNARAFQEDSMCIQLGRALFYDPILSRDSSVSCASCHSSFVAFTHVDHKVSHGIDDRTGRRNAPALMNLAWSPSFMWDGAVNHLDMQPLAPITNPLEMDEKLPNLFLKLQSSSMYRRLFKEVYGDELITTERFLIAMAAFLITLESNRSKYDAVNRGEALFTEQELRGYNLFKQQCNTCHTEPLFTNYSFKSNGISMNEDDIGRAEVTGIPADSNLFKVPTLRNISYSRPYMHDGRFAKLSDVVKHYAEGSFSSKASPEMKQVKPMTEMERIDLTSFLLTLTDSAFVFDKRFQYPFKLFETYSVQR